MNKITYTRVGDYLLPDIMLNEPPREVSSPLGRYGRMHKAFLREYKPMLYNSLLLSERLYPICREIDKAAETRLAAIENQEAVHEIILAELVYCAV